MCFVGVCTKGSLVWARLGNQRWWPAMVINAVDCGKSVSKRNHCWVFWFGDHKISEVLRQVNPIIYGNYRVKVQSHVERCSSLAENKNEILKFTPVILQAHKLFTLSVPEHFRQYLTSAFYYYFFTSLLLTSQHLRITEQLDQFKYCNISGLLSASTFFTLSTFNYKVDIKSVAYFLRLLSVGY